MSSQGTAERASGKFFSLRAWRQILSETASKWYEHDAMTQSAALAFYTLFSLAPVLTAVTSTAGLVFGVEVVRGRVVSEFQSLIGRDAGHAVEEILQASVAEGSTLGQVLGVAAVLFGATAFFLQLQDALNRVWEAAPRKGAWLKTLLTKRLVSFALVLVLGFLLLVSLALSAALGGVKDYFGAHYELSGRLLGPINVAVSFVVFGLLFALIYRVLPDVDIPWRDVWFGAGVTSAVFCLGKWLIGLYLSRTNAGSAYGAAGALVLITLWVYYASFLLLFGAEFTRVFSRMVFSSHRHASAGAKRVRVTRQEIPDSPR
jgi:membrane protein